MLDLQSELEGEEYQEEVRCPISLLQPVTLGALSFENRWIGNMGSHAALVYSLRLVQKLDDAGLVNLQYFWAFQPMVYDRVSFSPFAIVAHKHASTVRSSHLVQPTQRT